MLHLYLIEFHADIFITAGTGEMIHGDIVQTGLNPLIIDHPIRKFVSSRFRVKRRIKGLPVEFAVALGALPSKDRLFRSDRPLAASAHVIQLLHHLKFYVHIVSPLYYAGSVVPDP